MADVLTGNPSNVTSPLSATIAATASGSGGTACTTSAPHLFGNGDSVFIELPSGTIQGVKTITVVDSTHFVALGLTYSGSSQAGIAVDLSLAPQVLVPTDGDTFSQQLSGALSSIQAILDRTQFLQQEILGTQGSAQGVTASASAACANWHTPNGNIANVSGSGNTAVLLASCWDSWYSQWLVGGTLSTVATYGSNDGGKTWASPAKSGFERGWHTADAGAIAADVNPNNGTGVFWSITGTTVSVNRCAPLTTVAFTAQPFAASCILGTCRYFPAANSGAGAFYFVGLNASTAGAIAASSANGVGLWTYDTGALPSSWSAGSSFTTPRSVISDVGANVMLVSVCGQTPGSSTSKLLSINAAGVMADITPSFVGGTAKQITGVAYSQSSSLWGVLCNDSGSGASSSYLYISRDLVTWTLVHTFAGYLSGGLAVMSNEATISSAALSYPSTWVACLGTSGLAPDENTRIVYSSAVESAFGSSSDTGNWHAADYSDEYGLVASGIGATSMGVLLSNQRQVLRLQTGGGSPANSNPGVLGGTVAISDRALGQSGSGAF